MREVPRDSRSAASVRVPGSPGCRTHPSGPTSATRINGDRVGASEGDMLHAATKDCPTIRRDSQRVSRGGERAQPHGVGLPGRRKGLFPRSSRTPDGARGAVDRLPRSATAGRRRQQCRVVPKACEPRNGSERSLYRVGSSGRGPRRFLVDSPLRKRKRGYSSFSVSKNMNVPFPFPAFPGAVDPASRLIAFPASCYSSQMGCDKMPKRRRR